MNESRGIALSGHDIVCLSLPTWDGDYVKSTVHLVGRLAAANRVLFVDWPVSIPSALSGRRGAARRSLGLEPRLRRLPAPGGGDVHVLTPPPVLPANRLPPGGLHARLNAWNAAIVGRSVKRAMSRLGMTRPIVISAFNPYHALPLAGCLGERARVYYGYDAIEDLAWNGRHGAAMERSYLAQCDLVVTSSDDLRDRKKGLAPRTECVHNGVDFELFHRAAGQRTGDPGLCAGFIGSLDHRVDYDLLEELADRRPDLRLLLVGRVLETDRVARLATRQNVEVVGPVIPESLPGWLSRMDVGLIPFVCNGFTRGIYPLKLNEYLAGGRPVVMTPFAKIDGFEDVARTASGAEGFSTAIDDMTREGEAAREKRIDRARSNDWAQRAGQFSRLLAETVDARP